MFTSLDVLSPQTQENLSIPWIVAIRGIHKVNKNQISEAKVTELCDNITLVTAQISLSLAAKLLNGVIKIYRQHVDQVIRDMMVSFYYIIKPPASSYETERLPKTKPKKKGASTKHDDMHFVMEELRAITDQELMDLSSNVVDEERITMRDELPAREFEEEGFGMFEDDTLDLVMELESLSVSKRSSLEEEIDGPPRKLLKSTLGAIPVGEAAPLEPMEVDEPQVVPCLQRIESDESRRAVPEQHEAPTLPVEKKKKRKPNVREALRNCRDVAVKQRRNLKIDAIGQELLDQIYQEPIKSHETLDQSLFDFHWTDDFSEDLSQESIARALSELSDSLEPLLSRQHLAEEPLLEVPVRPSPVFERDVLPLPTLEQMEEMFSEELLPETSMQIVPFEREAIPHGRRTVKGSVLRVSPSEVTANVEHRQTEIIRVVKYWKYEEEDLTIEDVCIKPIKRFNIAVAFDDLLSLAKREYVELHTKPNSLELGNITRGRKLN